MTIVESLTQFPNPLLGVTRHQRYKSYLVLERARREIRADAPVAADLIIAPTATTEAAARVVYAATPDNGPTWSQKVMITQLLDKLDKIAIGVQMGVVDVEVWHGMSGFNITAICSASRNYIKVCREHEAGQYAALTEVEGTLLRMIGEEAVSDPTVSQAPELTLAK